MSELTYTKETSYSFKYSGDETYIHHFIDNILGLRYQSLYENLDGTYPTPLGIKGTNQPFQELEAVLVGERIFYEDENGQKFADLLYLLPDINYYMKIEYRKEYDMGEWNTSWGIPSSITLLKI